MLVYGVGLYHEDTGYTGVNIFELFKTLEEVYQYIDTYIDINVADAFEEEKIDIEEIKKTLEDTHHATYKILTHEDGERYMYEVVTLALH